MTQETIGSLLIQAICFRIFCFAPETRVSSAIFERLFPAQNRNDDTHASLTRSAALSSAPKPQPARIAAEIAAAHSNEGSRPLHVAFPPFNCALSPLRTGVCSTSSDPGSKVRLMRDLRGCKPAFRVRQYAGCWSVKSDLRTVLWLLRKTALFSRWEWSDGFGCGFAMAARVKGKYSRAEVVAYLCGCVLSFSGCALSKPRERNHVSRSSGPARHDGPRQRNVRKLCRPVPQVLDSSLF